MANITAQCKISGRSPSITSRPTWTSYDVTVPASALAGTDFHIVTLDTYPRGVALLGLQVFVAQVTNCGTSHTFNPWCSVYSDDTKDVVGVQRPIYSNYSVNTNAFGEVASSMVESDAFGLIYGDTRAQSITGLPDDQPYVKPYRGALGFGSTRVGTDTTTDLRLIFTALFTRIFYGDAPE